MSHDPHTAPSARQADYALEACRIIDAAVKKGHDNVSDLLMHLLSAAEPARAALTATRAPARQTEALERFIRAVEACGAMPEGCCLCASDRIGDDSKIHDPECSEVRAALAALTDTPAKGGGWQPIETAPNDHQILVAYDDGSIEMISAEDNDYDWEKYEGPRDYCTAPTHWMPLPAPPAAMKDGG